MGERLWLGTVPLRIWSLNSPFPSPLFTGRGKPKKSWGYFSLGIICSVLRYSCSSEKHAIIFTPAPEPIAQDFAQGSEKQGILERGSLGSPPGSERIWKSDLGNYSFKGDQIWMDWSLEQFRFQGSLTNNTEILLVISGVQQLNVVRGKGNQGEPCPNNCNSKVTVDTPMVEIPWGETSEI